MTKNGSAGTSGLSRTARARTLLSLMGIASTGGLQRESVSTARDLEHVRFAPWPSGPCPTSQDRWPALRA